MLGLKREAKKEGHKLEAQAKSGVAHIKQEVGSNKLGLNPHLLGRPDGLNVVGRDHRVLIHEVHNPELTRRFKDQKASSFGI